VIVIEQSNPQVVYVPSYDPLVVWGASLYPTADLLSPGRILRRRVGDFVRRWNDDGGILERRLGWGCGWGNNNININNNNNFNRNSNIGANRNNIGGGNRHRNNPVGVALCRPRRLQLEAQSATSRRAPYRDRATADRFGAQREATRLLTVRLVPGNSLAVKAAIWQAIGPATDG